MKIVNILKSITLVLCIFGSFSTSIYAQTSSRLLGDLSIKNKVAITFFGLHHFDNEEHGFYPGIIQTERTGKKGFVNFSRGSSWVGASELQHVDGYVCVYHTEPFTFPIGSNFKYRPVAISGARASDAAYYDDSVIEVFGLDNELDTNLKAVSQTEFWDVNGVNRSKITLTWDDYSGIAKLTEEKLAVLTIVGYRNNRWEVIPSKIDENMLDISLYNAKFSKDISSFKGGSITTLEAIPLNSYDFYTFGAINSFQINNSVVKATKFNVFPNPHVLGGTSKMTFETDNTLDKEVFIYNTNEQLVYQTEVKGNQNSLTLENVADIPGAYTIVVRDSNGGLQSKKLIVVEN